MNLRVFQLWVCFSLLCGVIASADDMSTLKRLSDVVAVQCGRHYGVHMNEPIEHLQNKQMSEVDKLACAFPYAFNKIQERLVQIEKLDPASEWGKKAYVTLAARIYNFDYILNTPNEEIKFEIMGLHPDLLVHHRILKQLTPYALALAYPHLTKSNNDLLLTARRAAASASELTPWSALLRQANGTDCYGPQKQNCILNKAKALQQLLQAIKILEKNESMYNYVAGYSKTREVSALRSAPYIRIALDIQKSLTSGGVDYILGQKVANNWWSVRPDLRDTLNYLAASDIDVEASANRLVKTLDLDCKMVFRNLFGLAAEKKMSDIRQALIPFNKFEKILKADPTLLTDAMKLKDLINQQDCGGLEALAKQLNLRGLLSRFQAYQIHKILISKYDERLSMEELRANSKRFALLTDIEKVIEEVQDKAKASGIIIQPVTSQVPQELVDYTMNIIKGDEK